MACNASRFGVALFVLALLTNTLNRTSASDEALEGSGTLSATVVGSDGNAVADARISLHRRDFDSVSLKQKDVVVATAITTADGRFRLGPLAADYRPRLDLRIEADGFAPQYVAEQTYSIFANHDSDLGAIVVHPGRVFLGQVLDADGRPRAGATVRAMSYRNVMGHTIVYINPETACATDADGRFRTAPLPVGKVSLYLQEPERQIAYRWANVRPGGEETLDEPIRLENDLPIVGTLRDESGNPISGAAVRANGDEPIVSDAEGKFVLRGHGPNAQFQMHVKKAGYIFINWGVKKTDEGFAHAEVGQGKPGPGPPEKELTVVMQRSAWIEGRAVDAETGAPVKLDRVVLCTFERKPNGETVVGSCRASNFEQPKDGDFRVPYSIPDEYHLTVTAAGYHDGEAFTPLVKELQPVEGVLVKLVKKSADSSPQIQTQRFTGTVTRDGKPVKSGWVALWSVRRPRNIVNAYVRRGRTTTGDPVINAQAPIVDGAYTLDVPQQKAGWYVVVEEPGQPLTQVGPFRIAANETRQLDIACVPAGRVAGRVKQVPDGWQGQLWAIAFSASAIWAETRVDRAGNFVFENLPPGEYGLKVGHDAFDDPAVPGPNNLRGLPQAAFSVIDDPWQRAVKVKVETVQTVEGVELELPQPAPAVAAANN